MRAYLINICNTHIYIYGIPNKATEFCIDHISQYVPHTTLLNVSRLKGFTITQSTPRPGPRLSKAENSSFILAPVTPKITP